MPSPSRFRHWLCRRALSLSLPLFAAAILIASAALPVAAADKPAESTAGAPRPNLILILADDLGYGDLGCFGQKNIATPNLDKMADEGLRFTQFYSGSTVCAPARCVLMTGLHT